MIVRDAVPLSTLTTFKIGGAAQYVLDCGTEADIVAALAFARERSLPWRVLGQGSNLLADDAGYAGVIIRPLFSEHVFRDDVSGVEFIADAGMAWDAAVRAACVRGLWGIENLAGIPGTVGASPVQNIGAYGMELADSLAWVEAIPASTGERVRLHAAECRFGYRDSRFKHEPDLIIMRVAFALSKTAAPRLSYADLAKRVEDGAVLDTPDAIATAVRDIRSRKFPDLAIYGTAGSFFKNPVISSDAYSALSSRFPELPAFPSAGGMKISLAWILDRVLSLRGFRMGAASLFEAQPLVIVAQPGASSHEVESLARVVEQRVKDATGIALEWEVRTLA